MADRFGHPLGESETILTRAAARSVPREGIVFVDVGARKIDANVTRDGVAIGAIPIDKGRFDDFFGGRPQVTHKIVSQSVAPGIPVAIGTKIDLELAEPRRVPVGVVGGVLADLREREIGDVFDTFVRENVEVRRVLARVDRPELLTPEDAETISSAFAQEGVELGDEPGHDVSAAFQTLKAGFIFGG